MEKEVKARKTRVKPDVETRETRGPLEPVEPVVIEPVIKLPDRKLLGTIPKPYTYDDACVVIDRIGLQAWRALGYDKKRKALTGDK